MTQTKKKKFKLLIVEQRECISFSEKGNKLEN